jgi:hypothetical protein
MKVNDLKEGEILKKEESIQIQKELSKPEARSNR